MPNQKAIDLTRRIHELIAEARLHRTCVSCQEFNEATEVCGLYNARPPARVIAEGCEQYKQAPPF